MSALTDKQAEVMDFIRDYFSQYDNFPSTRQITRAFGWGSQSASVGHLRALAAKGHIQQVKLKDQRAFYRFPRP